MSKERDVPAGMAWPPRVSATRQGGRGTKRRPLAGAPACCTVNGSPAMVSVAARGLPVFGPTVKMSVPLPDPLAGLVSVIHPGVPEVVQAQPAAAVMVTVPEPPAAGKVAPSGLSEPAQARAGTMVVTSPAVSLAVLLSPPPETVAVLVTVAGAPAETLTVSVIAG